MNNIFSNYINSIYHFCFDIFHDLGKGGIIDRQLGTILRIDYYQRIDLIMEKIKLMKFKHGRIQGITKDLFYKVKGTGIQVKEFFILFPLIDEQVPGTWYLELKFTGN